MQSDDMAVRVRGLGKKYVLGAHREMYSTLRDSLVHSLRSPFLRLSGKDPGGGTGEFWALRNVSFDVLQGEVVGIIGKNGAGKSTLLKILSRITMPNEGEVRIRGRIGSLLEVGTGFHPELSGQENIFLSGSILGMRKTEIEAKFDEIVKFSEIGKFLDTPVKRYSSGMYVRLAFAVAAHLDTEILVIDEVLAVGDAQFQRKCIGKMDQVSRSEGRTVLFVSHNMQAVRNLCTSAILLQSGIASEKDSVSAVISRYLESISGGHGAIDIDAVIREIPPDPDFSWISISFEQNHTRIRQHVENGSPLLVRIRYRVKKRIIGMRVFFDLCDTDDTILFRSFHDETGEGIQAMEPGEYESVAVIPSDLLAPRDYEIRVYSTIFNIRMCNPREGIRIPVYVARTGKSNQAYLSEPIRGKLAPVIRWATEAVS